MSGSNQLIKLEQLLTALDMLEKVRDNKELNFIGKELISLHVKDRTSTIYRLAMSIYHSSRFGEPILEEFFEPLNIYMRITENEIFNEIDENFLIRLRASKDPSHLIRTFISYLVAAYIYYKNV